jgi:hypothetical protein
VVVLKWRALKTLDRHNSSSYGDCTQSYARGGPSTSCSFSQPFYNDVASLIGAFSSVAAFANAGQINLSGNGTASVLTGQAISGEFFRLLGVGAAAGRLIAPSDDSLSAQPVVVLNYGYWMSQFAGSPSAIGKTVLVLPAPDIPSQFPSMLRALSQAISEASPRLDEARTVCGWTSKIPRYTLSTLSPRISLSSENYRFECSMLICRLRPKVPMRDKMARYLRIRHVVKTDRLSAHEQIQAICGIKPDGSHWSLTQDEAISQIEDGTSVFYVERAGGRRRFDVIVGMDFHAHKYLKTVADGELPGELLYLPNCQNLAHEIRGRSASAGR